MDVAANEANVDKITLNKLEAPEVRVLTPGEIRQLREELKLSRSIWAKLLNVGITTAQKWESGRTYPDGAALKLLNLVQEHGVTALLS